MLCEMRRESECGLWRGSKKGARRVGRASWPRNPATCASAHSLVYGGHGESGYDREGPWRRKRKGTRGATAQQLANRAREAEREEKRAGEETGADRSPPVGRERERGGGEHAGERGAADRWIPPVRQRGRAGARPGWAELAGWAAFPFSFSLDFLIPFLFIFSRVFNSKFKLGFKFK
jgi:hypothetical protein